MKISDLYRMPRGEQAYLFPDPVREQRRVSGEQTHPPFEGLEVVTLKQEHQQKFVVGTPVYDPGIGKTRYRVYRLNEGEDFSDDPESCNLDRIPTLQKAKIVEEEIKGKFKKLGDKVYVDTKVEELPPYGFEVRVSIGSRNKQSLNKLEVVLSAIGAPPSAHQS